MALVLMAAEANLHCHTGGSTPPFECKTARVAGNRDHSDHMSKVFNGSSPC